MRNILVKAGRHTYTETFTDMQLIDRYGPRDDMPQFLRCLDWFAANQIHKYNGNHFIFGWFECFAQSSIGSAFYGLLEFPNSYLKICVAPNRYISFDKSGIKPLDEMRMRRLER